MTDPVSNPDDIISAAAERENWSARLQERSPDLSKNLETFRLDYQIQWLNTGRIYWHVIAWLAGVVLCILISGFGAWGFRHSGSALIAYIPSTTTNVAGLFVLVAKWMYPTANPADFAEFLEERATDLKQEL